MAIVNFFIDHKSVVLGFLLACSEVLSLIPSVKANGIFQLLIGALAKVNNKPSPSA